MKKIFIVVFIAVLLIVGYAYDQFGWCKKLLFGGPTTHVIQTGEYLSEIAKKYYGRADYWRELALVNRSPNSDIIFPGEEIVIPSLDVIKEIRRTRWLSKVNAYMKGEEDIIAQLNMGEDPTLAESTPETPPEPESEPMITTPESESMISSTESEQTPAETGDGDIQSASSLGLVLGIIAILFVTSLVAFILIRKRKRSQQIKILDDKDLNIMDEDEEAEPDYQDYLRDKSERERDVLVS